MTECARFYHKGLQKTAAVAYCEHKQDQHALPLTLRVPRLFEPRAIIRGALQRTLVLVRRQVQTSFAKFKCQESSRAPVPPLPPLCGLSTDVMDAILDCLKPADLFWFHQTSRGVSTAVESYITRHLTRFSRSFAGPQDKTFWIIFLRRNIDESERKLLVEFSGSCRKCRQLTARGYRPGRASHVHVRDVYCSGCKRDHAPVFFSFEQLMTDDAKRLCIGRLGKVSLCSHDSSVAISWADLETYGPQLSHWNELSTTIRTEGLLQRTRPNPDIFCSDISAHQPKMPQDHLRKMSAAPRATFRREHPVLSPNGPTQYQLAIGWDLPLLKLNGFCKPKAAEVRERLKMIISDTTGASGFHGQRTCAHVGVRQLSRLIDDTVCPCFLKRPGHFPNRICMEIYEPCICGPGAGYTVRSQHITCQQCDAFYSLQYKAGYIYLIYQNSWQMSDPTMPAWLAMLDRESIPQNYWCGNDGCEIGDRNTWLRIVKQHHLHEVLCPVQLEEQRTRRGDIRGIIDDWRMMVRRSRNDFQYTELEDAEFS